MPFADTERQQQVHAPVHAHLAGVGRNPMPRRWSIRQSFPYCGANTHPGSGLPKGRSCVLFGQTFVVLTVARAAFGKAGCWGRFCPSNRGHSAVQRMCNSLPHYNFRQYHDATHFPSPARLNCPCQGRSQSVFSVASIEKTPARDKRAVAISIAGIVLSSSTPASGRRRNRTSLNSAAAILLER